MAGKYQVPPVNAYKVLIHRWLSTHTLLIIYNHEITTLEKFKTNCLLFKESLIMYIYDSMLNLKIKYYSYKSIAFSFNY